MTTTGADTDPLYASVDGVAYPLGRGECVFQARADGSTHVMTPEVLAALDATRPFGTLARHAAEVAARLPALAGREDAIQRVLQNLVARGLLTPDADYLRSGADAREPAPFAGVFVRAGDDAAALPRLLDSIRAVEGFDARAYPWFVLDEAREPAALRAHRDAIASFGRSTGARVEHLDAA